MDAATAVPDFMTAERKQQVTDIVRDAGRGLLRFIRRRVGSDADAEDVLQDVWQQLVTTLEDEPIERVTAWLYTVARNRIVDRYRKPRTASLDALGEGAEEAADFDLAAWLPQDDATPAQAHLRTLFWQEVQTALEELPAEQRAVFVWHELEELSFQDIAELTGENVNTLLSRKRYAVLQLRRRLAPLRDELFSQPTHRISP